jgi:hypothetical protein
MAGAVHKRYGPCDRIRSSSACPYRHGNNLITAHVDLNMPAEVGHAPDRGRICRSVTAVVGSNTEAIPTPATCRVFSLYRVRNTTATRRRYRAA